MKNFRYLEDTVILKLDSNLCIGCGLCATVCPHRVFIVKDKKARIVDHGGCMECGACARNCPVEAIFVNPDPGCGCAALIVNSWFARVTGKKVSGGCC